MNCTRRPCLPLCLPDSHVHHGVSILKSSVAVAVVQSTAARPPLHTLLQGKR